MLLTYLKSKVQIATNQQSYLLLTHRNCALRAQAQPPLLAADTNERYI